MGTRSVKSLKSEGSAFRFRGDFAKLSEILLKFFFVELICMYIVVYNRSINIKHVQKEKYVTDKSALM